MKMRQKKPNTSWKTKKALHKKGKNKHILSQKLKSDSTNQNEVEWIKFIMKKQNKALQMKMRPRSNLLWNSMLSIIYKVATQIFQVLLTTGIK